MSTFNLANKINVVNPSANVDASYGPYNNLAEVIAAIPEALRIKGRTVAVLVDGKAEEYWWKNGTTDNDLIPKGTLAEYTYEELKALKDANSLKGGTIYVISDFQTVHTIQFTQDTNIGPIEKIAVAANSTNSFEREAVSVTHNETLVIDFFPEEKSDINVDMDLAFYNLHRNKTSYANSWNGKLDFQTATIAVGGTPAASFATTISAAHKWSVRITAIADSDGVTELELLSNGDGTFEGDGSGTINYDTGNIDITFDENVDENTNITITYYTADSVLTKGFIRRRYREASSEFNNFSVDMPYDWRVVRFRRWAYSFDTGSPYPYMPGESKTYCLTNPTHNYIGVDPLDETRFIENRAKTDFLQVPNFWHVLHNFVPTDLNDYKDYLTFNPAIGQPIPEPEYLESFNVVQQPIQFYKVTTELALNSVYTDYTGTVGFNTPTRASFLNSGNYTFNNAVILAYQGTIHYPESPAPFYSTAEFAVYNITSINYGTTEAGNYTWAEQFNVGNTTYESAFYVRDDYTDSTTYPIVYSANKAVAGIMNVLAINWTPVLCSKGRRFIYTNNATCINQVFVLYMYQMQLQYAMNQVTMVSLSAEMNRAPCYFHDFSFFTVANVVAGAISHMYHGEGYTGSLLVPSIEGHNAVSAARWFIKMDDYTDELEVPMMHSFYVSPYNPYQYRNGGNNSRRSRAAGHLGTFNLQWYADNSFPYSVLPAIAGFGYLPDYNKKSQNAIYLGTYKNLAGTAFFESNKENIFADFQKVPIKWITIEKQIQDDGGTKYIEIDPVELRIAGTIKVLKEAAESENRLDEIRFNWELEGSINISSSPWTQIQSRATLLGQYFTEGLNKIWDIFPESGLKLNLTLGTNTFDFGANNSVGQLTINGDVSTDYVGLRSSYKVNQSSYISFEVIETSLVSPLLPATITSFVNTDEIPLNGANSLISFDIDVAASTNCEFTNVFATAEFSGKLNNTSGAAITITLPNDVVGTVTDNTGSVSIVGVNQTFDIPATSSATIQGEVTPLNKLSINIIL